MRGKRQGQKKGQDQKVRLATIIFTRDHPEEAMEDLANRSREGIQAWIRRHIGKTGKLENSIKASVYGRHIVIESDAEYARAVDQGIMSSRPMWHLINRVIPLKLRGGRTILRRVSLESLLNGKWIQKPRPGVDFVRKGLDLAKSMVSFDEDQVDFQVVKES